MKQVPIPNWMTALEEKLRSSWSWPKDACRVYRKGALIRRFPRAVPVKKGERLTPAVIDL